MSGGVLLATRLLRPIRIRTIPTFRPMALRQSGRPGLKAVSLNSQAPMLNEGYGNSSLEHRVRKSHLT
jgi:hypothetical protein